MVGIDEKILMIVVHMFTPDVLAELPGHPMA